MMDFDQDIFANHMLPFAVYIEPVGYGKLSQKRPRKLSYQKNTPRTCEIATSMYVSIPNKFQWGIHTERGWDTRTNGKTGINKQSGSEFPKHTMVELDIIKHFAGRTGAVGNVERFVENQIVWDEKTHKVVSYKPLVYTLRIDVDADKIYDDRNIDQQREQINIEKRIINALGLPYSIHTTGGRGHHIVIPLPGAINVAIASCMMRIIKTLLTEQSVPEVKICVDNLTQLMRLPGGINAKTRRLGLWIDPATTTLYPIETQADLMATGLIKSFDDYPDIMEFKQFEEAAVEIHRFLHKQNVEAWRRCSDDTFALAIDNLKSNYFINKFLQMQNPKIIMPVPIMSKPEKQPKIKVRPNDTSSVLELPKDAIRDEAWAQKYFNNGYSPGASYDFLIPNGVYAALILFKTKQEAEVKLIEQALSIKPCPLERLDLIKTFVDDFDIQALGNASAYLNSDYILILEHIANEIDQMNCRADKKRHLKQLVEIMLLEYQKVEDEIKPEIDEDGTEWIKLIDFEISTRVLASRVSKRWSDDPITYKTVQRLLDVITGKDGSPISVFTTLDTSKNMIPNFRKSFTLRSKYKKTLNAIRNPKTEDQR